MAQTVVVEVIDDLDGSPNAVARTFSLDGISYQIDLTEENFNALQQSLAPFMASARRTRGSSRQQPRGRQPLSRQELAKIREWALANGHQVSSRGRVRQSIIDAHAAEHS
ncbi:hypothetical protein ABH924_003263 [Arthrobacter sp. GAS37]|uniref:histone-like nucleoid-structuring protein Lsr2 n=1 Tax=Arthrobacter sp. GAS37 TaxID=3156261 RepID=UPI003835AC81